MRTLTRHAAWRLSSYNSNGVDGTVNYVPRHMRVKSLYNFFSEELCRGQNVMKERDPELYRRLFDELDNGETIMSSAEQMDGMTERVLAKRRIEAFQRICSRPEIKKYLAN